MSTSKQPEHTYKVIQKGFGGNLLQWRCEPGSWMRDGNVIDGKEEGRGGSWKISHDKQQLILKPDSKKDYWRRTYYTPLLIKDDGPALLLTVPCNCAYTCETNFTVTPRRQFDQGGLMVYFDSEHWIKAGIEVVDNKPKLSCVVTNRYSDWSTQPWTSFSIRVRVLLMGDGSFVVEASPVTKNKLDFIRIAHLDIPSDESIQIGVFGCCPELQDGCSITFNGFSIREGVTFEHNADGNLEESPKSSL